MLWEFVASHKAHLPHTIPNLHSSSSRLRYRVSVACRECPVSRTRLRALRVAYGEVPFESFAFFGASPFVSRPLPQLYGAIRRVILRQAHPSLRLGMLAFLVLLASATVYLRTAFARLIQLDALHSRPASS